MSIHSIVSISEELVNSPQDAWLSSPYLGYHCVAKSIRFVLSLLFEVHNTKVTAALPSDQTTSKRAVGSWDDAYTKATAALAKLSQSDKVGIVTGVGWQNGPCVGNTKAASSIGYPSLCLQGTCYDQAIMLYGENQALY